MQRPGLDGSDCCDGNMDFISSVAFFRLARLSMSAFPKSAHKAEAGRGFPGVDSRLKCAAVCSWSAWSLPLHNFFEVWREVGGRTWGEPALECKLHVLYIHTNTGYCCFCCFILYRKSSLVLFFFLFSFPFLFVFFICHPCFLPSLQWKEKEPCGVFRDISTSGPGRYKQASVRINLQILAGKRRCDGAYWNVKI